MSTVADRFVEQNCGTGRPVCVGSLPAMLPVTTIGVHVSGVGGTVQVGQLNESDRNPGPSYNDRIVELKGVAAGVQSDRYLF